MAWPASGPPHWGYRIAAGDDGSATLYPPRDAGPEALSVWLLAGAGPKYGRNRNHPDLTAGADVAAEVQRLIGLGARRVDVGQRDDDPFVVLADRRATSSAYCAERRDHCRSGGAGRGVAMGAAGTPGS